MTNFQAGTKARSYAEKSLQFDNPENINLKSCGYNIKCPAVLSIYLDRPIINHNIAKIKTHIHLFRELYAKKLIFHS